MTPTRDRATCPALPCTPRRARTARRALPLALAALLAVAAPLLHAGTPIDQTRPLAARGKVEIDNPKGRIEVRASNRSDVRVTGTLGDGGQRLVIDDDGGSVSISIELPDARGWRQSDGSTLLVEVPVLASIEIESVSANIDVAGVAGNELEIDTVSGNIIAVGAPTRASVESVSGNQRLTLNSDDASADSVSGNIVLAGRLGGEIKLETVSGNITLDSRGKPFRSLSSETVSGDANLRGTLAPGGRIHAESVSGGIKLVLPRDLSARVSGDSFSGTLSAPGARINRPEHGPGSDFQQRYGNGDGEIKLESFSGDATLLLE